MSSLTHQAIYSMAADTSAFRREMDAATAASKRVADALEGVVTREERVTRATHVTADALARFEARIDPVIRAEQRRAAQIAQADRFLQAGLLTQDRYAALLGRVTTNYELQVAAANRARAANDNLRTSIAQGTIGAGRFGGAIQQAGYQIGDFAVQVASGQGVLRPFIQQGSQLAGAFGPWGAIVGAAGAVVGALATTLLGMGDAAEKATKQVDDALKETNSLLDEYQRAGRTIKTQQEDEIVRVGNLARAIRAMSTEYRQFAQAQAQLELYTLNKAAGGLRDRTEGAIDDARTMARMVQRGNEQRERMNAMRRGSGQPEIPGGPSAQQMAFLDAVQRYDQASGSPESLRRLYADMAAITQMEGRFGDTARKIAEALKEPVKQAQELGPALTAVKELIEYLGKTDAELDTAANRETPTKVAEAARKRREEDEKLIVAHLERQAEVERTIWSNGEKLVGQMDAKEQAFTKYLTGLEVEVQLAGLSREEREIQLTIMREQEKLGRALTDTEQARVRILHEQRGAIERQREETEKAAKEIERIVDRTTDRLIDMGGDALFDRLTGRAGDFWDTFKNYGLRVFSQLAAEMALRPLLTATATPLLGTASPACFGLGTEKPRTA